MITSENYFSQFLSFGDSEMNTKACAVTCVAMVLSQLGKFERWQNSERNLESFLAWVISQHRNNGKVVKRKIMLAGEDISVTVGMADRITPKAEEEVVEEQGEYYPTFTYNVGYDHRFSKELFAQHGVNAELREGYSIEDIRNDFANGKLKYFLPSIHSLRTRERHVLVLQAVGSDTDGEYLELIDPADFEFKYAKRMFDLPFFAKIYNNYGTAIYA